MTEKRDSQTIKERFCKGYGLDCGLFHLGYAMIQMRCHVWSIAPTVQSRMRKQWQEFAALLSKRGVITAGKLEAELIIWAIKQIFKKIDATARDTDQAIKHKKELLFTINNVFSVLPLLQWNPIGYQPDGNVSLKWTLPEEPALSEFDAHYQSQKMQWLGRCMAVINSGAASTMRSLGAEIYAHCYRGELAHSWISTYKKAWSAFMKWCPYETTDQLTHEDITAFALWLLDRADDKVDPLPVEVGVFALNMVNDGLARLRGEHWKHVEQPFTTEEVARVPHPAQIPISSIAVAEAHKTTVPVSKSSLKAPHVREDARQNYYLGSSMLIVGQRIIKLRSDKAGSDVLSQSNANRARNWQTFCSFMSAKNVQHLSQLDSSHIEAFIQEQYSQLDLGALKPYALKARIAHPLALISSILPLEFEQSKHFADNKCITPWKAPEAPTTSAMPQDISTPEFFARNIVNFGLGNGLIGPAYQILIEDKSLDLPPKQKELCAVTFGVFLKDEGLKQLQEVTCTIGKAFFDQLEDRIEDGLTSRYFGEEIAAAANIIMAVMQDGWDHRKIRSMNKTHQINPLETSTDHSIKRPNSRDLASRPRH